MPGRHTVPVVCGIIEHGGRFLGAQRGPGRSNAGLWEFPGGKVRRDETAEAALARELREELDIEISVGSRLSPHLHAYPSITIELIPFICELVQGRPQSREHMAVRWLESKEAQSLAWAPADIPVLKEYLDSK